MLEQMSLLNSSDYLDIDVIVDKAQEFISNNVLILLTFLEQLEKEKAYRAVSNLSDIMLNIGKKFAHKLSIATALVMQGENFIRLRNYGQAQSSLLDAK